MAFKKTGNGRGDRPTNPVRRPRSGGSSESKSSFLSPRANSSSSGFKKSESADRPNRKFDGGPSDEKKPFSRDFKKSGEGFSAEKKFKGKPSGDFKSRPYGSKDFTDRPSREGGFKKEGETTGFKRKPYGTKDYTDRPPRDGGFKKEGEATGFKRKPYGAKDYTDKPSREVGFKRDDSTGYKGKATGTDDRPFRSRNENGTAGRKTNNTAGKTSDRPRSSDETTERPQTNKTRERKKPAVNPADRGKIRLNRYISNAGICSRRKADELIVAGVIAVNGEVVSALGFKVDPSKDEIRYNGETLKREKMVYVLLNKPKDYITTTEDPQERRTVMHLVDKASKERIYPIGRLDRNTTGLLLMTNDGDLADKLSHPKSNVTKLYHVELDKSLSQGDMNKIAYGLELEDGLIKPDSVSYVQGGSKREVGIQIHSGKNRIVRRIFEHLGYDVVKLDRAVYANLTKKDLPRGRWRYLEEKEVIQLKHLI